MAQIIEFVPQQAERSSVIDMNRVAAERTKRVLQEGMLTPSSGNVPPVELAGEHTSEPIKSMDDIERITTYLVQNERYRDNMLFILGINFGLRISDLLLLRFSTIINDDFSFKTTFPILEMKTKNTRTVRKNRYITVNDAVMDAVMLYLEHNPSKMDDYLFRSESGRGKNSDKPLSRMSADRILKGIATDLGLDIKMSTHSLRKTFGYHQMMMADNDPRKLLLLQKIFGHSSAAQTLDYIGITSEEIQDAYTALNLGHRNNYSIFGTIREEVRA